MDLHLAQFNVATLRHALDHPDSVSYAALLDEVNAAAEASPGFVWRHGIDSRDAATSIYDNPLTLVNASVWQSARHLRDFTYKGLHRDVFRRRHEWFDGSGAVMWWIPAGSLPTLAEGVQRLDFLRRHGSTPYGFEMGRQPAPLVVVQRSWHDPDVQHLVGADADGDRDADGASGPVHVAVLDGRAVAVVRASGGQVRTWGCSGTGDDWLEPALRAHASATASA